jgi:hypothetical protein
MAKVIPNELRNRRGLRKLKDFYAEQLRECGGDESAPVLIQLRADIKHVERELAGKPLVVSAVAARK